MYAFVMICITIALMCTLIYGAYIYDVWPPTEPQTELEKKCQNIKQRLAWFWIEKKWE